jgi:small subunit ribosomal protein S1
MGSLKGKSDDDFFGTPLGAAMNVPFTLEVGDIISGRISKIDEEFVYVSTGFKSEGRIPVREFKLGPDAEKEFKLDDEIEVMVDRVAGEEIYLSFEKVVVKRRWDELQKKFEDGEPVEVEIIQQVKGGYRTNIGLTRYAFLPGSHLGIQFENPQDCVGKKLMVYIVEFNRETENIIVSHREWKKKQQQEVEGEVFVTLKPGTIIEGRVTRLTNFGAFVDVGSAVEGLVHVSELAWSRVNHPSQVLACGDTIKVKVLDIDTENKKISLSLKQAMQDPWETAADTFKEGQEIVGTVSKIVKFGAFVRLSNEFEGLLHISEIQGPGATDDKIKLNVGDEIKVKIMNVDSKGHRIKLGLNREAPDAISSEMKRYIDNGSNSVSLGDMINGALDDK